MWVDVWVFGGLALKIQRVYPLNRVLIIEREKERDREIERGDRRALCY
jgi:hypothetical protein